MTRVLFVCTGNTCRSPMAEGLLMKIAGERGLEAEVRSAGTAAIDGIPISGHAAAILQESGALPSDRGSRPLTAALVDWADLILTMTMSHKQQTIRQHQGALDKIYTLKEFANSDDPDNLAIRQELEQLTSELHIHKALNEPIPPEKQARLYELESKQPDYDIVDPFGGTMDAYRYSAEEIEAAIHKVVDKLLHG